MRHLFFIAAVIGLAAGADAASSRHHAAGPGRHAAVTDWTRTVVSTPEGGARMGNPKAVVKLIEYGSRTCPHCAHFAAEGVPELTRKYVASGQVSYEFREFPIHGAIDMAAILLGRCVGPAHFFPLLSQMMAAQPQLLTRPDIPQAEVDRVNALKPAAIIAYLADYYGYVAFVKQHGVPTAKARACLADQKAIDLVAKNTDAGAAKYQIRSTPTFIVNETVAQGAYDWATLEPVLRAAGAK